MLQALSCNVFLFLQLTNSAKTFETLLLYEI
jgi:hypothetical protein